MTSFLNDDYLSSLQNDPLAQFHLWYDEAIGAGVPQPHAMTLATATRDGKPSARIVLMKSADSAGFSFVTNYGSRKGRELETNPFAALIFHWPQIERQIRIEGRVGRLSPEESSGLFSVRPRDHQISSASSRQSERITLEELDTRYSKLEKEFEGKDIPRPEFWGGYRIVPETFEFWQHRFARMNDRALYVRTPSGAWQRTRLSP
jgi:pyridoxamine 5'-phosphate oxidase